MHLPNPVDALYEASHNTIENGDVNRQSEWEKPAFL